MTGCSDGHGTTSSPGSHAPMSQRTVSGLGAALLRHAMELALAASGTVGVRLLVVNALHEQAAGFYRHFGLEPSPTNPLDLMITVNDIRAST